ncbi:MAG TPA: hypothetical protein PLC20_13480 [Flavobacteriales bacterium]|nr:hypothetical protein [Flavobacteriales bacterium]
MEHANNLQARRLAGTLTLVGSLCMLGGAAVWGSTGVDMDQALDTGDLVGYLNSAAVHRTALIVNLSVWILGVFLLGAAARLMALLSRTNVLGSLLVRYNYGVGIPLVIVSYMAWMAVVVRLPGQDVASVAPIAEVVGWFGVRADWLATIMVLGLGPFLIVRAGRGSWVPGWLSVWGQLCLVPGVLTLIGMYCGGMTTYGFLIIPMGMAWMIAASVVLLRRPA